MTKDINWDEIINLQVYRSDLPKEKCLIKDKEELIENLRSLRTEALEQMHAFKDDTSIFYKDYNTLSIVIYLLSEEK